MSYQQNLVVIGAGAGGLVSAYIASAVKANVTLIESNLMGGDCLNYGCVPSKALIHIAEQIQQSKDVYQQGIVKNLPDTNVDFSQVMQKVKQAIAQIQPKDSVERYRSLGVNVIEGKARILSPTQVQVESADGKQVITSKKIIIATGGKPKIIDIKGLDPRYIRTSESIWHIDKLPKKMLIVGSGAIACELGQAFSRLGSKVSILARSNSILNKEDKEAASIIDQTLQLEGIKVFKQCKDMEVSDTNMTFTSKDGASQSEPFDIVLMAAGKTGNSQSLGLENTNIQADENHYIAVNEFNQ